ncbi:MAG: D-alanyl-D-alanine carboxypeptidase/D-alanyl-D-alanine-endopeptidase [Rhodocyclaceae bacterium]|nr:D-alanyl-D-alanine carboxypeptidase/D-alanyl-D-alanine-endopeptidase [Rhodocyclaceae bacterium]
MTFCVFVLLWTPFAQASSLPATVLSALEAADIPPGDVAVTVQEVGSRKPLLNWNAGKAMNPASVMKLLTTWTALETLGPAYTWRTDVYYRGTLRNGVLDGDLYIKGSGDPALTIERFGLLLRDLRARGLSEIRGDLVLDRGRFQVDKGDPGAFDGEGLSPYNTLPDALLLNFKALRLTLLPEAKGVKILPVPELAGLVLENRITLSTDACGSDWDDGLKADWQPSGARLALSGAYPVACGERVWNLSPMDPADYLWRAFRPLWQELGGKLSGGPREAPVPEGARLLSATYSPPLSQAVRDINKFSNNVMARQLFLTLGAERGARPAALADGAAAVRAWLNEARLPMPELVLENGAGLSRKERISAASLNRLLLAAWASPVMPEFVSSLPIVAVDGTMRKRLAETGVAGRAHIKSGSLANVKTIAGYVTAKNGRRYAVVFLANHANAAAARPAQDALLQWVWAGAR